MTQKDLEKFSLENTIDELNDHSREPSLVSNMINDHIEHEVSEPL